jgi:AcrR family transcriptional regulator
MTGSEIGAGEAPPEPAASPPADAPTRERILEAAQLLFYEQGYEATSLKQIAEAAGAHGGSVYHFFPSKQRLVEAVLESYRNLLEPVLMEPARAAGGRPVDQVLALLEQYRAHLLATEFRGGCPIGNLALELAASQPRTRELVVENFEAWQDAVAGMLEAAELPGDIRPTEVAAFVLTVMEGAVMQAKSYRSIEPFDASVRQLRRYLESL